MHSWPSPEDGRPGPSWSVQLAGPAAWYGRRRLYVCDSFHRGLGC